MWNIVIIFVPIYINKYQRSVKMKPIHVKTSTYIDFDVENNKILKLHLVIMQKHHDVKILCKRL